jgi:hypothetical protein
MYHLFLLNSLTKNLSILFSLPLNQLFVALILCIDFLFFINFSSDIYSFFLPIFWLAFYYFSKGIRYLTRLLIWESLWFFLTVNLAIDTCNFSFRNFFIVSHRFSYIVSSFSFNSRMLIISPLTYLVIYWLLKCILLSLHAFLYFL